jgi:hypothetical protein
MSLTGRSAFDYGYESEQLLTSSEEEFLEQRQYTLRGELMKCQKQTEVYSRIVGYFRPVQNWNIGKKQEYLERKCYAAKGEPSTD